MMATPADSPLIALPNEDITVAPYTETKVATVLVTPPITMKVQVEEAAFPTLSTPHLMKELERIFRSAGTKTLEDANEFAEDLYWSKTLTPVNEGSLYDDVIFEVGIYVNSYGRVMANTTFGKKCTKQVLLHESLRQVSEALFLVADEAARKAHGPIEQATAC